MKPVWLAAIIALAAFMLSLLTTVAGLGFMFGYLRAEVRGLREDHASFATKDDVRAVSDQVSEIKGMFRLTLKSEAGDSR